MDVKVDRGEKGWEISVTPVQLSAKGQELFGLKEMVCTDGSIPGTMLTASQQIHQMHRDIVYTLPPSVESLGHSPVCEVQGMYARRRLITVQGHPEFTEAIVDELIESRYGRGIFTKEMYEDGMSRVGKKHDGVACGVAFLRFLLDD